MTTKDRDGFLVEKLLFPFSNLVADFTIQNLILHFTTTGSIASAPEIMFSCFKRMRQELSCVSSESSESMYSTEQ